MTTSGSDTDMTAQVAVIGCGHWGVNLVRSFHELGALAAISESEPERAAELSRRLQVDALSFDGILAQDRIEGVVIATPAETHAAMALRALEAGKHVFVEKPLTLDIEDAHRIRRAAGDRKRIVMVGHLLQYHPAFLRMRRLVEEGRLGRLRHLYSNRLSLGKFRRNENVFWSFAPHDVSMILSLAGDMPESIWSIGHSHLYDGLADMATTHLRFGNGIGAHIFVSWLHPYKEHKLVAVGDEGMAVFDDTRPWAGKLTLYPHKAAWRDGLAEPVKAAPMAIDVQPDEPLRVECRHFLDCLRSGRRPRTDVWEGIRVVTVLDASRRSMQTGRPIETGSPGTGGQPYFAHPTSVVDEGCRIGAGTRIWHFSHILKGSRLGRDCVVGQNVAIGPDVTVGDRCKIQNNVSLYPGVVLEDGVFCGPSCVFTNVNNPRAEIERKTEFRPTRVGRGATIGANATIVCGHDLGAYSFVAAGAVVTRDVPPHALVAGNPARRIGWVSRAGERLGDDLVCPRTGARYRLDGQDRLAEVEETAPTASCAASETGAPA